jgi:hypothetical protein
MFFKPNDEENNKISDETNIQIPKLSENNELSNKFNILFFQKSQTKKII